MFTRCDINTNVNFPRRITDLQLESDKVLKSVKNLHAGLLSGISYDKSNQLCKDQIIFIKHKKGWVSMSLQITL